MKNNKKIIISYLTNVKLSALILKRDPDGPGYMFYKRC